MPTIIVFHSWLLLPSLASPGTASRGNPTDSVMIWTVRISCSSTLVSDWLRYLNAPPEMKWNHRETTGVKICVPMDLEVDGLLHHVRPDEIIFQAAFINTNDSKEDLFLHAGEIIPRPCTVCNYWLHIARFSRSRPTGPPASLRIRRSESAKIRAGLEN